MFVNTKFLLLAIFLCVQVIVLVSAGKDKDHDTIIMNEWGDIVWKEEGKGDKKGGDTIVMKGRRKRDILLPVIRANRYNNYLE